MNLWLGSNFTSASHTTMSKETLFQGWELNAVTNSILLSGGSVHPGLKPCRMSFLRRKPWDFEVSMDLSPTNQLLSWLLHLWKGMPPICMVQSCLGLTGLFPWLCLQLQCLQLFPTQLLCQDWQYTRGWLLFIIIHNNLIRWFCSQTVDR